MDVWHIIPLSNSNHEPQTLELYSTQKRGIHTTQYQIRPGGHATPNNAPSRR